MCVPVLGVVAGAAMGGAVAYGVGDYIHNYIADFGQQWDEHGALGRATEAPSALGPIRSRPLHHWDIHSGVRASDAPRELCLKVGEAALALASRSGGVALDMFGFRISTPEDLLPR